MPVRYSLDIRSLRRRYAAGSLTPTRLAGDVLDAAAEGDRHHAWIHRLPEQEVLAQARHLESNHDMQSLPLYGIPFAIKDNIDVAGCPTTAGCPAFSYTPAASALVVQRLLDAGAIVIGKTNLDQFATGLSGSRSPYGACASALDARYISGGSSSGSAIAVALNLVSFALGTDTAGSGRVPAAFNNIVGLKPTRGALSTRGVVPACRSLDCVSVFALTVDDAWEVYLAARGYDADDPYSRRPAPAIHASAERLRCGVPREADLDFCGDAQAQRAYAKALALLARAGGEIVEIDFTPFRECAALLYQGPWLAERYAAIGDFYTTHARDMHPVTREIIGGGAAFSAADAFAGAYRLRALKRQAAAEMAKIDVLAVPSVPTHYTLAQVQADPITLNSKLGIYTNFVNLLDLAALAVPSGIRDDCLPAGITLIAPARSEPLLCSVGTRMHRLSGVKLGATGFELPADERKFIDTEGDAHVTLAVVGAHLSGMALNHELTGRGARLLRTARTAACYRLYALPGTSPAKPGLVRCAPDSGHPIEVELWRMPVAAFGSFVARVAAPLAIGSVLLEDGTSVSGFVCENHAVANARDISAYGGWRKFMRAKAGQP